MFRLKPIEKTIFQTQGAGSVLAVGQCGCHESPQKIVPETIGNDATLYDPMYYNGFNRVRFGPRASSPGVFGITTFQPNPYEQAKRGARTVPNQTVVPFPAFNIGAIRFPDEL